MNYVTWWTRVWSLAGTLGVGLGMLEWSAPVTAVAVLVVAAVAAGVTIALTNELFGSLGLHTGRGHLVAQSLALGAGIVGGFAVLSASPAVGMFLVALAAGTSPPVLAHVLGTRNPSRVARTSARSTAPREPESSTGQVAAQEPDGPPAQSVATMSIGELCALWRHTFWQLRDEDDPNRRGSLIAVRQACLEELEKRNPAGFAAWLDSGGRASGVPERFMLRPPTDGGPDGG